MKGQGKMWVGASHQINRSGQGKMWVGAGHQINRSGQIRARFELVGATRSVGHEMSRQDVGRVGAGHQINRSGQVRSGQDLSWWEPSGQ